MLYSRHGREDKEWAKRYILDPLTAPEPHQLDGPGTSFFNPRRSLSLSRPRDGPASRHQRHISNPEPPRLDDRSNITRIFRQPQPTSQGRRRSVSTNTPISVPAAAPAKSATPALAKESRKVQKVQKSQKAQIAPPPKDVPVSRDSSSCTTARSGRKPPQTHRTQGTSDSATAVLAERTSNAINRVAPSLATTKLSQSSSNRTLRRVTSFVPRKMNTVETNPFRHGHERAASRSSTGASRAPSHSSSRSLDSKHSPGQHHHHHPPKYSSRRRGQPMADTIDSLDKTGFGGAYHHGGPYDATLASVNANKKYAPMEAVKDSNIEALKATPREYIVDSLQKHVPLQGTGIIPPGMPDMRGNIMNYEEGADLMREPDAGGGAYKRWDFVQYSPDDLKGKGEPSFTIERTLKHSVTPHKHSASFTYGANGMPNSFEMQDQHRPLLTPAKGASESIRRQSFSSTTTGTSTLGPPVSGLSARPGSSSGVQGSSSGYAAHTGLQRNASTGHRITDGLKRRLGSLRRKHD